MTKPKTPSAVKSEYTLEERHEVIMEFQSFIQKIERASKQTLSAHRLREIIDNVFLTHSEWMRDDAHPIYKTVFSEKLDPKTIRAVLSLKRGLDALRVHPATVRVLHAFLEIVKESPPPYLAPYLEEKNSSEFYPAGSYLGRWDFP